MKYLYLIFVHINTFSKTNINKSACKCGFPVSSSSVQENIFTVISIHNVQD